MVFLWVRVCMPCIFASCIFGVEREAPVVALSCHRSLYLMTR